MGICFLLGLREARQKAHIHRAQGMCQLWAAEKLVLKMRAEFQVTL